MATCADAQGADGTKLAVILARALIDGCATAMEREVQFLDVEPHLASALESVKAALQQRARPLKGTQTTGVTQTAAKGSLDVDMAKVFETVGRRGIVFVESGQPGTISTVETDDHTEFEAGMMDEKFISDRARGETVLDHCLVLVTLGAISSVAEMVQVLTLSQRAGKPVLLLAADVEDTALGVAAANFATLRCVPVKLPGRSPRASGLAGDITAIRYSEGSQCLRGEPRLCA
jgi:chaperonin GroEL